MRYSAFELRFDYSPAEIDALWEREKEGLAKAIDAIVALPETARTAPNTLLALESASARFSNNLATAIFLKYVSSDEAVRAAADSAERGVQQMMVDLFAREDLYSAVKAAKEKAVALDPATAFLLDEYLVLFKRNGLELSPEKRAVYVEKKKRLVEVEAEFAKRLVEWDDAVELTREELDGMSEDFIGSLEKKSDGKYRVTLSYPNYNPFMENAKNAEARRKLDLKYLTKGGERNRELLEEALQLREEIARLLGFPTHAHYVLERRMAKTPEQVMGFLGKLRDKLIPKGKQDLEALLALKREETHDPNATKLESHEWRYYENLLKKRKYRVDTQAIKEYFPLNVVLKGMFEIYQTLFGVAFIKDSGPSWHESVELFRVEKEGETIAFFYMDLFPREGKYSHAAAFTLINGHEINSGEYAVPVSSIVANFNPPAPGKPSLLEHSEVETLFHEFGHIMHQVLTTARYASLSGTNVKTDFVEAPSQMLENWVWERESLRKLSGHYQDPTRPLPDDQIDQLIKAKLANSGLRYLRQLSFATIDMLYHTESHVDSTAVYEKISREVMLIPIPKGALPQAGFGHLMGGYDAGYYGYLWSEVYAQDMFTRFEKEGLLNPKTGADYLNWILRPGGLRDPFELLHGFLGRAPDENAFLKSLGL